MTHGDVLALLRRRGPTTRRALQELTRLSRTTLVERIDTLQRLRLIREGRRGPSANGRPPVMMEFDETSRVTLTLDVGAAHVMVAITDLAHGRRRTVVTVKVATGIGAGLVVNGRLHIGDSHGAGQLGHLRVPGMQELCTCGERGCLATVASGRALLRQLAPLGVSTLEDVVDAVEGADPAVLAAVTDAGRTVGTVLSNVATMLDPGAILFGGALGRLEPFVDTARGSIKELTYARAAQGIAVGRTVLGDESAVTGLAALIVDSALEPTAVDHLVAAGSGG